MKKLKVLFSTSLLLLGLSSVSMAKGDISVLLNGSKIYTDVPAQISNNRILVPIRAISENMGAKVDWNQKDGSATIVSDNIKMTLYINSHAVKINDEMLTLDQPPIVTSNRIMVPIRFISENMGARVNWYDNTKTATIEYNKSYKATPYTSNESFVPRYLNSFIATYGQPKYEENHSAADLNGYIKSLNYDFGTAVFIPSSYNSSEYVLTAINSTQNLIGSPRDIRIGDTVKYVMDKFPNNNRYEPYVYEDNNNKYTNSKLLYSTEAPSSSMGVVNYDNNGKITSLEYFANPFTANSTGVIYHFDKGHVSSITLNYAYM